MFPVPPALICQAEAPLRLMRIDMHDALAVGEIVSPASYNLILYVRAPASWLNGDTLNSQAKETVLAHLYGPNWRSGNEDGSAYVVLEYRCRPMTSTEEEDGAWHHTPHSWYYRVSPAGILEKDE